MNRNPEKPHNYALSSGSRYGSSFGMSNKQIVFYKKLLICTHQIKNIYLY